MHLRIREEITKNNKKRWTINFMDTLQQMKMKRRGAKLAPTLFVTDIYKDDNN